ncbi:MAG: class I SAM-dependent methyltransferase [Chloroflexi bacterium]|nr:class I SAM-dependent methyltransferase [Chloroflexota bacterium]
MANGLCRIDGDPLLDCIDLGDQYISDFVAKEDIFAGDKAPLRVGIGPTSGLVQLHESFPPEKMFRRYWYRSGINESMRRELKSVVESASSFLNLKAGDTVLDIASNDGTLLSNYDSSLNRVGIDPSNVAGESPTYDELGIDLVNDFFSAANFESVTSAKAKIVTAIAMFYALENPNGFLTDVRQVIDETGVLVLQLAYTPLSLEQNEFGNFTHEHLCYYDFRNLNDVLDRAGFEVFDVELNAVNGGSIRVYATVKGGTRRLPSPLNLISIGKTRKEAIVQYEKSLGLQGTQPYREFMERIDSLKTETVNWLEQRAEAGETVIGYGASTKGNVLLQYYGITPELLPFIAERSEEKWGLYTAGSGIPIISEDEMRERKPDYLFALPWFFISSFVDREVDLLASGTRFVVPQPELRIVGGQ